MHNYILFMILTGLAVLGKKTGFAFNELFDFSFLFLTGYIFSKIFSRAGLPRILGFIVPGLLFGHNGLELVSENIGANLSLINGLALMAVIAGFTETALRNTKRNIFISSIGRDSIFYVINSVFVFIILSLLNLSIGSKISLALFAGILSPDIIYISQKPDNRDEKFLVLGFFSFVIILVIYTGLFMIFSITTLTLKESLMPISMALMSILTGVCSGFFLETVLKAFSSDSFFIRAVFYLMLYPLGGIPGMDFVYIALGIGLYMGIFSEKSIMDTNDSLIPGIILMVFFGLDLSPEYFFESGIKSVIIAALLSVIMIGNRILFFYKDYKNKTESEKYHNRIAGILIMGPLSLFIMKRYLPGIEKIFNYSFSKFEMYQILNMALIIILMLVFFVFFFILRPSSRK